MVLYGTTLKPWLRLRVVVCIVHRQPYHSKCTQLGGRIYRRDDNQLCLCQHRSYGLFWRGGDMLCWDFCYWIYSFLAVVSILETCVFVVSVRGKLFSLRQIYKNGKFCVVIFENSLSNSAKHWIVKKRRFTNIWYHKIRGM